MNGNGRRRESCRSKLDRLSERLKNATISAEWDWRKPSRSIGCRWDFDKVFIGTWWLCMCLWWFVGDWEWNAGASEELWRWQRGSCWTMRLWTPFRWLRSFFWIYFRVYLRFLLASFLSMSQLFRVLLGSCEDFSQFSRFILKIWSSDWSINVSEWYCY